MSICMATAQTENIVEQAIKKSQQYFEVTTTPSAFWFTVGFGPEEKNLLSFQFLAYHLKQ